MVKGASQTEQSCTASKLGHVVHGLLSAALLLVVGCYAPDARAQAARRAHDQRERARVEVAAEPRTASPARGEWYGWQTLTADAVSIALFLAGGAEGTWPRRALVGG